MIKSSVNIKAINVSVSPDNITADNKSEKIDVDNRNIKLVKGEKGTVFTPYVDEDCNLSWTNDGDLDNPPTVNIKGDNGDATVTPITNIEIEAILRR